MNTIVPHRRLSQRMRGATATTLLLVALLPFSACQALDREAKSDNSASDESSAAAQDALLDYVECMRENGVPMKDPKPGVGLTGEDDAAPGVLEAAEAACGHLVEDYQPSGGGDLEITAEQKEEMLAQAQCLRERGWEAPDPEFAGGFAVNQLPEGIDPNDPSFKKDLEECAEESGVEPPSSGAGE
ncbi:MAG: hypothetical protein M3237_05130 [Actinomycetota bacterium]|nr:hypothetical protein [Actinomycetota bacterium]